MAFANSMTSEELLEYAALDAFGLLDEYEAALYTRSFHNAPAAIQDRIVDWQAQLVSDESLLPSESPDPDLRGKVLGAVADAIEQETAQLEPLAVIGRGRGQNADVVGRISLGFTGQVWRAAAFAACAGLIVLASLMFQLSAQHNRIAEIALLQNTDAQLEKLIGPTFKDYIFDPAHRTIAFKSTVNGQRAVLFIVEGSDEAFLLVEGLPQNSQPYSLAMNHGDGRVEKIQNFESNGGLMGLHVAINSATAKLRGVKWEISGPSGVLLASI